MSMSEVTGHTDSRGSDQYNMGLSLRRAEAVRDYLISERHFGRSFDGKRLWANPSRLPSNDTDEGRFKNRRVELNPQTK